MRYLRLLYVFLAVAVFLFHLYAYMDIDDAQLRATVSGGVPRRFIQTDQETLTALGERLSGLEAAPRFLYDAPKERDFGRKKLFLPD